MPFQNISGLAYWAASVSLQQFSLIVIAAAGLVLAVLLRKHLKKDLTDDAPLTLYSARFDQRLGTPHAELRPNPVMYYPVCHCLDAQYPPNPPDEEKVFRPEWQELPLHTELQDTNSAAWQALEAYIANVREKRWDELNPRQGIGSEMWEEIVTLPKTIGALKSVKFLQLYGSHLVRIPPEIGGMTNLEEFDPYTSHCLHWLPYEITRCKLLKESRVSTRALYGNYKYRPPFPGLPQLSPLLVPTTCSVCEAPLSHDQIHQAWISLWVATDVLPLLVHACSEKCIENLPKPAFGYVQRAHRGGLELEQPPANFMVSPQAH